MGIEYYLVNETKHIICAPKNAVGYKLAEWRYDGDYFSWLISKLMNEWRGDEISICAEAPLYLDDSRYTILEFELDRDDFE